MNIEIKVPDGESGDWKVSTFEVTEEEAKWHNIRASIGRDRSILPGKYKKLTRNNYTIMSNTPAEINDLSTFIYEAKKSYHILINGLGLGVALTEILKSNIIRSITIIEKSEDVIKLVAPSFKNDKRVQIIHADAFEWKPPMGERYDVVWHDIWDDICEDNFKEMTKLHRKYGKRCDWQDSWCKELCRRLKDD